MVARAALLPLLAGICLLGLLAGCRGQAQAIADKTGQAAVGPADKPIAGFRQELLELAFRAASAIPIEADLKDRCRAQEAVVAAWLELDQPRRVLGHIEQIRDWRRGAAYADLAMYCARHGRTEEVRKYLDIAAHVAEGEEDWRRDRIRVKIAQVYAWLGQHEQAKRFGVAVETSETGKVVGLAAASHDANSFDAQMKEVGRLVAIEKFDIQRNALESAARLFDDFYGDLKRRSTVEDKIKASWGKMPPFVRIDLLLAMAGSALERKDQAKALALVNEAQAIADGARWPVDYYIPLTARLAGLRCRAGDKERVGRDIAAALVSFDAEREKVLSTERAATLLLIAEAYQAMGDTAASLAVYKKALAEGVSNPNGRPRALDLSACCRSLALRAVEPDAELRGRIREALAGLRQPW